MRKQTHAILLFIIAACTMSACMLALHPQSNSISQLASSGKQRRRLFNEHGRRLRRMFASPLSYSSSRSQAPSPLMQNETAGRETGVKLAGETMWQRGCMKTSLPVFYINMDKNVERREWMRGTFGHLDLHRISATNGTDLMLVKSRLDPAALPDTLALLDTEYFETYKRLRALPGQLGNILSHLDAIDEADKSGAPYAITLEDDASDQLLCLLKVDGIESILTYATAHKIDDWDVIRLQWNDYTPVWNDVKTRWAKNGRPPLMPHSTGWGNVAALWSRRGIEKLLKIHTHKQPSHPSEKRVWRCAKGLNCAADLTFWPELKSYVATPPLVTYRQGEIQTKEIRYGEVKESNDHRRLHVKNILASTLWALEAREIDLDPAHIIQPTIWSLNLTNVTPP